MKVVQDLGIQVSYFEGLNVKIEFVEPIRENSVVSKFHSQNPTSPIHHLALEVDDVDLAIKTLTEKGYMLLDGKHIRLRILINMEFI